MKAKLLPGLIAVLLFSGFCVSCDNLHNPWVEKIFNKGKKPGGSSEYTGEQPFPPDGIKASGAAVAAPSAAVINTTSITLFAASTPATEQPVEYGINTSNTAPADNWQSGTTFTGLIPGTTYYFFARSAENDYYETGAPSTGTGITTIQQGGNDTGEISIGTGGQPIQGNTVTVVNGGSVTFYLNGSGYTNHNWTLNGTTVGTNSSYTFDTSDRDKEPGRTYTIGLRAQKDGKPYFTQIMVRIDEE